MNIKYKQAKIVSFKDIESFEKPSNEMIFSYTEGKQNHSILRMMTIGSWVKGDLASSNLEGIITSRERMATKVRVRNDA